MLTDVGSNDYGNEFEVCCKSFLGQGKKHGLYAESQGQLTADVPYKYAIHVTARPGGTSHCFCAQNGDSA